MSWETVQEWEKRTGRPYIFSAPVYVKQFIANPPSYIKDGPYWTRWGLHEWEGPPYAGEYLCVVADEKGMPPQEWLPDGYVPGSAPTSPRKPFLAGTKDGEG